MLEFLFDFFVELWGALWDRRIEKKEKKYNTPMKKVIKVMVMLACGIIGILLIAALLTVVALLIEWLFGVRILY